MRPFHWPSAALGLAACLLGAAPAARAQSVEVTNVTCQSLANTHRDDFGKPNVPAVRKEYAMRPLGRVEVTGTKPGQVVTWEIRVRVERQPRIGGQYRPLPVVEMRMPGRGNQDWDKDPVVVKPFDQVPIGTDTEVNVLIEGTYKVTGPGGERSGVIPKLSVPYTVQYD